MDENTYNFIYFTLLILKKKGGGGDNYKMLLMFLCMYNTSIMFKFKF